jgi:hypothetical protein
MERKRIMKRFRGFIAGMLLAAALAMPASAETDMGGFVQGLYGYYTDSRNPVPSELAASEVRLQLRLESFSDNAEYFGRLDFVYDDYLDPSITAELREGYIKFGAGGWLDMKVGRQIITWGTGDLIFINDLFPKDWVSFFSGRDDQYLKAPQNALRFTMYGGQTSLDVVYTPRFAPDVIPSGMRLSYYNPMAGGIVGGGEYLFEGRMPEAKVVNGEISAKLSRYFGNLDGALYFYRGFYKTPVGVEIVDMYTGEAYYPELMVYGASVRTPLLGGIFWLEGGYYDSREDTEGTDPLVPNSSLESMAGFERQISSAVTANLQYYNSYMIDHDSYAATLPEGSPAADEFYHLLTSRVTMRLMMENLNVSLFAFYSPSEEDVYGRASVTYRYTDNVSMALGANLFHGEYEYTTFGGFQHNDNVYMKFTYGI